ncbi:hypothetical protein OAP18_03420 [Gammaproteobacteria bacterium]|nr:hypothetical protein [Gammaproteobacteria bacterium]
MPTIYRNERKGNVSEQLLKNKALTLKAIEEAVKRLGYLWFTEGDYNLNLVGIRSSDTDSNAFNDCLIVAFFVDQRPHLFIFDCTTDPGIYWRKHPINVLGTAIVKPGQYPGLWKIGKHQGRYEALVQRSPVTVYRDNNKDQAIDVSDNTPVETGFFGINCHKAGDSSKQVDKWSAGCQVLSSDDDFGLLMALCRKAAAKWGNSFTYTLIDQERL